MQQHGSLLEQGGGTIIFLDSDFHLECPAHSSEEFFGLPQQMGWTYWIGRREGINRNDCSITLDEATSTCDGNKQMKYGQLGQTRTTVIYISLDLQGHFCFSTVK